MTSIHLETPPAARKQGGFVWWLPPAAALIVVLWFEAEVPGLPRLEQGTELWRALGDSGKGQGLSGLLSIRAVVDVASRLGWLIATACVALAVAAIARGRWGEWARRAGRWVEELPDRAFGTWLLLASVALALVWFFGVRGTTPRLGDEIAYLFQARLFGGGKLWMAAPPDGEFFTVRLVTRGKQWFSQYPPGHSLLLAPLLMAGVPWLLGPLAGAAGAHATWRLGTRLYGSRTGRFAGCLALLSPFFLFQSASYFSHSTCLAACALAALGVVAAVQNGARRGVVCAALAGLALAMAALIRPLTAVGVLPGIVALGFVAARGARPRGGEATSGGPPAGAPHGIAPAASRDTGGAPGPFAGVVGMLAVVALAAAVVASVLPFYNKATTGRPWVWGYEMAQTSSHALGFGQRGDLDVDYTPARALFNARVRARWLDGGIRSGADPIPGGGLFFWPFPMIALPLLLLRPGRASRADLALVLFPVALAAGYLFYYYLEICWGPRYLYESSFALFLLVARGALSVASPAGKPGRGPGPASIMATLLAISLAGGLAHAGLVTGERAYDPVTWATSRVDRALDAALKGAGVDDGVVFLKDAGAFYEVAWRRMFVDGEKRILFARDRGDENHALLAKTGRRGWVATFNNNPRTPRFSVDRLPDFIVVAGAP